MSTIRNTFFALGALVALAAAMPAQASSMLVVPGGLENVEGNTGNSWPFHSNMSMRYQQVYDASEFTGLEGPHEITQIMFRPDATNGEAFSSTIDNLQITLSTTTANSSSLSSTLADNVGADAQSVFSGSLTFSSSNTGPEEGPRDFDIVINLAAPFVYNPANGALLMDITHLGATSTFFDAHGVTDDGIARMVKFLINDEAFISGSSLGLVTKFTVNPVMIQDQPEIDPEVVPTPTASLTGLIGFAMLGAARRRRA
ncbi:MAG: hypothetical protein ACYTGQ_06805 [Planctomycetota bacterium]